MCAVPGVEHQVWSSRMFTHRSMNAPQHVEWIDATKQWRTRMTAASMHIHARDSGVNAHSSA
eukprot:279878-Chlamydomonas_euryale.AAC.2